MITARIRRSTREGKPSTLARRVRTGVFGWKVALTRGSASRYIAGQSWFQVLAEVLGLAAVGASAS